MSHPYLESYKDQEKRITKQVQALRKILRAFYKKRDTNGFWMWYRELSAADRHLFSQVYHRSKLDAEALIFFGLYFKGGDGLAYSSLGINDVPMPFPPIEERNLYIPNDTRPVESENFKRQQRERERVGLADRVHPVSPPTIKEILEADKARDTLGRNERILWFIRYYLSTHNLRPILHLFKLIERSKDESAKKLFQDLLSRLWKRRFGGGLDLMKTVLRWSITQDMVERLKLSELLVDAYKFAPDWGTFVRPLLESVPGLVLGQGYWWIHDPQYNNTPKYPRTLFGRLNYPKNPMDFVDETAMLREDARSANPISFINETPDIVSALPADHSLPSHPNQIFWMPQQNPQELFQKEDFYSPYTPEDIGLKEFGTYTYRSSHEEVKEEGYDDKLKRATDLLVHSMSRSEASSQTSSQPSVEEETTTLREASTDGSISQGKMSAEADVDTLKYHHDQDFNDGDGGVSVDISQQAMQMPSSWHNTAKVMATRGWMNTVKHLSEGDSTSRLWLHSVGEIAMDFISS